MLSNLRRGDWVSERRYRIYPLIAGLLYVAAMIALVSTSHGNTDDAGHPLGFDYESFYSAGSLARDHRAHDAYVPGRQYAREQQIFNSGVQFNGWYYPPPFLLPNELLAGLPYLSAMAVWLAVTIGAYLATVGCILPRRGVLYAALGFGGFYWNLNHGSNGFFTAALMGGALVLLPRRPVLAGILFGTMVYKPHFAVLIPLVLVASRQWRAFAATGVTALGWCALASWRYGTGIWQDWWQALAYARVSILEIGEPGFFKMQSLYGWLRYLRMPVEVAAAAQALLGIGIVLFVVGLWRAKAPYELKAAVLLVGALMLTPYSFHYDAMILAPCIAFYARLGLREGFMPYEKTALALVWMLGLVQTYLSYISGIFPSTAAVLWLLVLMHRRAKPFFGAAVTAAPHRG